MSEFVRPVIDDVNRGFWEGVEAGELRLQRCDQCGEFRYPAETICPRCLGEESTWTPVSGRGEILSYVIFHQKYANAWAERVPYNVVLVQLAEGPRMISNVVPLAEVDLQVGARLSVVFDDDDGFMIPRFEIVDR